VGLNTVKRYARMPEPQALRIAPTYRQTLVDPYRDHLRARRPADPAVPVTHLLAEIRELGYTGSANVLVRYLNQDRAEGERPVATSRHARRLLLTNPDNLRPKETTLLEEIAAACPEMAALADLVSGFAALLTPTAGNDVNSPNGSRRPVLSTCRTCAVSPTVSRSTRPLWTPASPCLTTTVAPKASTPASKGS
jgi:hypothetical protein